MSARAPWFAALREFIWRLRESPKDYRYGGLRAVLRWIFKGEAADVCD